MDAGHELTEKRLKKLEKDLEAVYQEAGKEMKRKLDKHLSKFKAQDAVKRKAVQAGELSVKEYNAWRNNQLLRSSWMRDMINEYAQDELRANQRAAAIINEAMPEIYAENYNYGAYDVEKGAGIDTGFTLYDRNTVERLVRDNPQLLPAARIDIPKDLRWNRQLMQSALMQGVLAGEGVRDIAKRLQRVTDMNHSSALRNARTMVTGAENGGRLDSFQRAQAMGIELEKVWVATLDDRTRHSHRMMDGEAVPLEDTFSNDCEFPGDPMGAPSEVYNCRCTMVSSVKGFTPDMSDLSLRNTDHFDYDDYEEWKNAKAPKSSISSKVPNDWSKTRAQTHSKQTLRDLVDYGASKGIKVSGINRFDGDPKLLRSQINALADVRERYPLRGKQSGITLMIGKGLPDAEFANKQGNMITLNPLALRDRAITETNLRGDPGFFASTKAEAIVRHEYGHILADSRGNRGVEVTASVMYNNGTGDNPIQYIGKNISRYGEAYHGNLSADSKVGRVKSSKYKEVVPEVLAKHLDKPSAFTRAFMNEYMKG